MLKAPIARPPISGIIVATPTGSTAYAAATGASIVAPAVPCIIIAPICPHSLSFRPIMVPSFVVLKVRLVLRKPHEFKFNPLLNLDS